MGHGLPITMEAIDHDLLNHLVLVDTPGTGDPLLLREMARDFLPICDLVLFFFPATSPLDATDLPLLKELQQRLPFIPLKFIITRADEHRIDTSKPLTESNFDSAKATQFVGKIMSRLGLLPELSKYSQGDFLLIDNKSDFNISALREDLDKRSNPANLATRLTMHSHKVTFFLTNAERLRDFFSTLLEAKLSELKRVVATAEKNILDYQEVVKITNVNMTKNWFDHHATIHDLQNRASERISDSIELPSSILNFEPIAKFSSDIHTDIQRVASTASETMQGFAVQTGFMQLKTELTTVQRNLAHADLDKLTPHTHGFGPIEVDWVFGDSETSIVPEYYLAKKSEEFREKLRHHALTIAKDIRKSLEGILKSIQERYIISKCESIIGDAQSSLMQDLDDYFQSVKMYQGGVFATKSQESIAKLGIGRQMDSLLKDFTDEDKQSIKLAGKQGLFPEFDDVVASTTTQLSGVAEEVRTLLNQLGNPQLDQSTPQIARLKLVVNPELLALFNDVRNELQNETNSLVRDLQDQLAGSIASSLIEYDKEKLAASRARKKLYWVFIGAMGLGATIAYLLYRWVTRPVGSSLLEVLGWGVFIEIVGNFLGLGFARYKDHYPIKSSEIKERHLAVLTDKVKGIVNQLAIHKFMALQPTVLGKKLEKLFTKLTLPEADSWQNSVEDLYKNALTWNIRYKELRSKYLLVLESFTKESARYFEDHKKNLDTLRSTAHDIRARAIEPSFHFLAETSSRLQAVKDEISAIKFM